MGDALTGREEESKHCFHLLFYLFIYLPFGGGSVPFVHARKYAPEANDFHVYEQC